MVSIYPDTNRSRWILSHRGQHEPTDPQRPNNFFLEVERSAAGNTRSSAGILLVNKECPWRCLMCDLWKHTLAQTVPLGSIPAQIDFALTKLGMRAEQLKLYNSGSFFDSNAIPPEDFEPIAARVNFARNVVVESHPKLVGDPALRFRHLLEGELEVALGLETSDEACLKKLNKGFGLRDYEKACAYLLRNAIGIRTFVLLAPPFVPVQQAVEAAVRSSKYAFSRGSSVVSLIATRTGNGALEALMAAGEWAPPSLSMLEEAQELALLEAHGRLFVDTWGLERFSECPECFPRRLQRMNTINLTQRRLPRIQCRRCSGQS